jgi:magnesium transporter
MLNTYPLPSVAGQTESVLGEEMASPVVWFDLLNARDQETAAVERVTGLHVPTLAEISEIESTSRLHLEGEALYISIPLVSHSDVGMPVASPIGLVLSPQHLISVRFAPLASVDTFAAHLKHPSTELRTSSETFVGLLEVIVDRIADVLENIGSALDQVSLAVFRSSDRRRPGSEHALRDTLRKLAAEGDHISKIRDSLLAMDRTLPFVVENADKWLPQKVRPRLKALHRDIMSLRDYDDHLSNKIQFLLDASLGLINIEQSDIFRILTIVSIIGIPPTLVAGIYGMNFKNMPELSWSWGYEFGWGLIIISAVIPLIWCRFRRWI